MKSWNGHSLFRTKATYLMAFLFLLLPAMSHTQDASHASGWVVIPVEEYQSLRSRAFPAEREPEQPPVEATLTRVDYDLRVDGELATGRATLTIDVLKDGWVRVAIPSGLLVREARLEGKLVSLAPGEPGKTGGRLSAVLSHPGRASLFLDIALPVISQAGEESIVLPPTASGVTRAAIQLPLAGVDVSLAGGLLEEKPESTPAPAGTARQWIAYGRGNEPLTFSWRRRMDDHRVELPLRMRGSLVQLLGLGEDVTTVYAEANIEVMQGAAGEVRIQLPEKVTINQVSGAMVADWEMKAGELSVTFLEPVQQTARFVINGETRTAREGQIQIPLLRLLNTERETGGVAVEVMGAGEIKDLHSQGLETADASELGEMISSRQSPSLAAFRFRPGDATKSLTVDIARYDQQAVLLANIEEARYQVLMSSEGKILVEARYAVRNNQRNFLKITLPQGAMLWSAALAGKPVRPGQAPDGSVLLPLEKSRAAGDEAPAFAVEVVYLSRDAAWHEKGEARLALPAVDLPISRTGVTLYHPTLFRVTPAPGAFRLQAYEAPSSSAFAQLDDMKAEDKKTLAPQTASTAVAGSFGTPNSAAVQQFAESYWTQSGTRTARVLPIRVSFPPFGSSLFLVSELTAENHAEVIQLNYQHEKKAGAQ
jgi:hypothetical protein